MHNLFLVRLKKEIETKRRIAISVWAFAYEIKNAPVVSDADYDHHARMINLDIETDRPDLDQWFKTHYSPDTGMWIHQHPELDKIERLYNDYYSRKNG